MCKDQEGLKVKDEKAETNQKETDVDIDTYRYIDTYQSR